MFMLMFLFGLISFVTAAFHLFLYCGMEKYKGDRFSPHRKKHGETSGFTLWELVSLQWRCSNNLNRLSMPTLTGCI